MKSKNIFIFDNHALIQHLMSYLRDKNTPTSEFRKLMKQITTLMGYKVLKHLTLNPVKIKTPMKATEARRIPEKNIPFIVIILRAGDGMREAMLELIPTAKVGYIGLRRVESKKIKTNRRQKVVIEEYLNNLPSDADKREAIILDPMLASGTSASHAITLLKEVGVKKIKFMCIVSCDAGLTKVTTDHPDVKFFCAGNDKKLLPNNYISPGLGDAGDRLCGTM